MSTTSPARVIRRPARRGSKVTVSPWAVLRTELRLHLRHGIVAAVAGLTGMWVALLLALPPDVRTVAVPWVLFLDLATLGFVFVPALAVVERGNGVTGAIRLTRLSPARALLIRVGLLGTWSMAAAGAVVATARPGATVTVILGALLTTVLLSLLAVVMIGRHETLTGYLPRIPAVGVPLLMPALVHGIGLWDGRVLWLSPATGALELLAGRWSWLAVAWVLVWVTGLGAAARRIGFDVNPQPQRLTVSPSDPATSVPSHLARAGRPTPGGGVVAAVRAFARADRRTLLGDGMLVLLVTGVVLLALLVRVASGPGVTWIQSRYSIDLTPHLPAFWALVVVLHTPMMAGALCGLLFLEDRDAGLLPAIATTRASLRTLVAYRLVATAVATALAVAVVLVVVGANHPAGVGGLIATALVAAAVSSVPAMLMATLVRDRVAGMALMKAMGLPLYLPLAWWFVDGPAGWLFGLAPTGWAVRAFWAGSVPASLGFAAIGAAMSLLLVAVLLPRLHRSVAA